MSLPVLVAIVVVGIALCVAAVHFTGGSKQATLAAEDDAIRRFAEDFPDETIFTVRLTEDRRTAFLVLDGDRTGIVRAIGDRFLTRIVTPPDIASIEFGRPAMLSIRFKDFTWGGGQFAFGASHDAGAVLQALGGGAFSGEGRKNGKL
ncbi:hypothetical protein [Pseudaminobacter soli (ex Li et al. 2025)]|uniref:Uncharacterized protein n=1 Tax=Pseudaminobacter soli (ex Li et al. 2025) TaxID=1295366 RepID=A0A2P7S862_9HYPH|nr:hypothetical protein [Mesorhizobium soli]PSJ58621.1 hypothetical protein C7I85_19770 [Mesorhizobium soli]